jgi:hypothetical protein
MANRPARISKSIAMPGRRAWAAWIVSILVVIVAWAPLLGTLHQALVRHVVCEHGDLIEPDERAPHADRALDVSSIHHGSESSNVSVSAAEGLASHEHSHCSVGTLARNVATVATSNATCALLAEDRPVSLAARDANPVRSVLSSAPKTSPPAV